MPYVFNYLLNLGVSSRYYSTKRLTNVEKNSFSVPQNLHEVIIGLILGDCFIHKHPRGVNACLHFEQGLIHEAYIIYMSCLRIFVVLLQKLAIVYQILKLVEYIQEFDFLLILYLVSIIIMSYFMLMGLREFH